MLIYSLPVFFTQIGVLSPMEFALLVMMIAGMLWVSSPQPQGAGLRSSEDGVEMRQWLMRAWLGQQNLLPVFWPFFLLLNLILFLADSLAKSGDFTVSSWDDVHFVMLTPVLIWTVCVWRNSAHCSSRLWSALARLMTLAAFFEYGLKILIRSDYPRVFFNCQEILLDYGVCF